MGALFNSWIGRRQGSSVVLTTPYSNLYSIDSSGVSVGYVDGLVTVTVTEGAVVVLANWLALLPVTPGHPAGSQCARKELSEPQWPTIGTAYCDKAQANKVLKARLAARTSRNTTTPVEVGPSTPSPLLLILGCAAFLLLTCILCICYYAKCCSDDEEEETDDEEALLESE